MCKNQVVEMILVNFCSENLLAHRARKDLLTLASSINCKSSFALESIEELSRKRWQGLTFHIKCYLNGQQCIYAWN